MSASSTNIDTQKKRHRGPLFGIALSLVFAGALFFGFLAWTVYLADNPEADSPITIVTE